jgi:hypothetical protein
VVFPNLGFVRVELLVGQGFGSLKLIGMEVGSGGAFGNDGYIVRSDSPCIQVR